MSHAFDGQILLASSPGDEDLGGGLFAFDGRQTTRIDRLSSTGLHVAGHRLLRILRAVNDVDAVGELLVYDSKGVQQYCRIDGVGDAHDVLWDGTHYLIASPQANSVFWITPAGETARVWRAPGDDDSWHLNCLVSVEGNVFACAFGRFGRQREWNAVRPDPTGVVFDLVTGKDVLTGLAHPHHPRFVDGTWVICNSVAQQLVRVDPSGGCRQYLQLQGFTRGLAITDDYLFVGESAPRHRALPSHHATIAVVRRDSWQIIDRIPLSVREIYDLVLVPPTLVNGVSRGFNTNRSRVAEQNQYAMFLQAGIEPARIWATADPLPRDQCKVHISADLPSHLPAGGAIDVSCVVKNLSSMFYVSAPPHPVHVAYKWIDPLTNAWVDPDSWQRAPLPRSLPPGAGVSCSIRIIAPTRVGDYILKLTLVQELVAWFDDLDEANALTSSVKVTQDNDHVTWSEDDQRTTKSARRS